MLKLIGCGAAGGKAVINVVEKDILPIESIMIINTTSTDIPNKYMNCSVIISEDSSGDSHLGAGKERDIGKDIAETALINTGSGFAERLLTLFAESLDYTKDIVIIVSSTEGGSGSGISTVVAEYMKILGINVMIYALCGFEKDVRGLQNTFKYFKDLNPEYIIQATSNKKFLNGFNQSLAEKAANDEFAERIRILCGMHRRESEQQIDETDQFKCITLPGFMTIERIPLNNIKNNAQYTEAVNYAMDDSKSLDNDNPGQKRLALYYNITAKTKNFIDFDATVIQSRLGQAYEVFEHIQEPIEEDPNEYVIFISAGMNLPIDEIEKTYNKFNERSSNVNRKTSGFDALNSLDEKDSTDIFNLGKKSNTGSAADARAAFLKKKGVPVDSGIPTSGFSNVKPKYVVKEDGTVKNES